jgi:hypothetical protein
MDEKAIKETIMGLGILALPRFYELLIEQDNKSLMQYIPMVLPLDKMISYNIQAIRMQ